jgi:predicted transposase YdaD
MRIPRNERVRVKAACLAHLIGLKLTPRRQQILGAFLGIYLKLSPTDEAQVVQELAQAYPYQQEEAMELLTQWHIAGMEEGREEGLALGLAQGREEGQHAAALLIVQRLLSKRFGPLPTTTSERLIGLPTERLEVLAADLLDFTSVADLAAWLDSYGPSPDVVA